MEIATYRKYRTEEEASVLIELLQTASIEYLVEDISAPVDITFTGGTKLEDKVAIKLKSSDFEKADRLLSDIAKESIESVSEDHYLFEFTNEELFDVLENYTEWGETDFILAQNILKERGNDISAEKVLELKNKKIFELSQPEKGNNSWLYFGFFSALFGGVLGVFIGYHHYRFKKTIPTGEKVYAYDEETRKTGKQIYYLGLVAVAVWLIVWLFKN